MMQVPVRIVKVPFLIPTWAAAQVTIPRTIFIRKNVIATLQLIAHELAHVMQWERHGVSFPFRYLMESMRVGYQRNTFEVEARHFERNGAYLAWAKQILLELEEDKNG